MKYDDILYKEHPKSLKHPSMSLNDRAKIFLPFAALKGYEELIEQKNKKTINKIELSQDALEELDEKIHFIQENSPLTVSVTYYKESQYHSITGLCQKIDIDRNEIKIEDTMIPLQSIYEIII